MSKPQKCKFENRKYKPCKGVQGLLEDSIGRGKGLHLLRLVQISTGRESQQLVCIKSGDHAKEGILVNFCPICGAKLSDEWKSLSD